MLMANNHACPVSQSATRRDTNDLPQGQRSLFLEGKLLTVVSGEGRRVGGWGGLGGRILCWFSAARVGDRNTAKEGRLFGRDGC